MYTYNICSPICVTPGLGLTAAKVASGASFQIPPRRSPPSSPSRVVSA